MALRLFKKKDGSPTGFAKIIKGVTKVASTAVPFLPVPGAGVIGNALEKLGDKIGLNVSSAAPQGGETIGAYADRVLKGVGGAVSGFTEQVSSAPVLQNTSANPIQVGASMTQGFAQNKFGKYILYAALGLGGVFMLKKLKVI